MTETKEKKAEVQIKTGKKTTAQKAFRIAELFVIWAVRSFLYGQPNQSLRLYHVHGFLPKVATKSQLDTLHIRSICLTEADYNMLYNQPYSWPIASQLSFFRENICLFIGCSLSDPNIRRLLEITAYNPPKHYAILPMMYKSTDASGAVVPKQFTTKDRLQIENHFYRIGINILWVRDYSAIPEWLHKLNRSIV